MLTNDDTAWFQAFRESHWSWAPFIRASLKGKRPQDLQRLAGDILVYHNHIFVSARQLVEAVIREAKIPHSSFDSCHEYGCALAIHQLCERLSPADARAVLVASGYYGRDLEEMAKRSEAALKDPGRELWEMYGNWD
ncbi:hypothetical protein LZ023_40740 (plasmid) [Pseudomonas silvicola]|nr:hypothetical protein LZ023_41015 [Pseudomonas silvicola]WAH62263.1 hypothetical protein LZ023_40740 [Pseudomonas silvicola]